VPATASAPPGPLRACLWLLALARSPARATTLNNKRAERGARMLKCAATTSGTAIGLTLPTATEHGSAAGDAGGGAGGCAAAFSAFMASI